MKCVVRTACVANEAKLVEFPDGLLITSWHPIRIGGTWCFPSSLAGTRLTVQPSSFVFNFLLESQHIVVVNGIECICLGHGIKGDEVATHGYYGTEAVVNDLMKQPGWKEGFVTLDPRRIRRDNLTTKVTGLESPTKQELFMQSEEICTVINQ